MTTDNDIAKTVCTKAELTAWTMHHHGMSQRSISHALHISRSAVQSRLENARRKIRDAKREAAA